ncbi:hypothetical protein BDY17DRAFT_294177 [Neohortaea acidophila]|uniref:Uncharacterized protein n=1 Tax=Neohortaea acidophila TaxID=245834 RepID=A0A6A6Q0E7_9PEZI|nr:uncharacterized protein BDY17DRAFT_294177 [Neohortaea acidophila]KAF2485752.1 hypothetical protein BDY17DRAFT_294177 [Neohortaea acidophila]
MLGREGGDACCAGNGKRLEWARGQRISNPMQYEPCRVSCVPPRSAQPSRQPSAVEGAGLEASNATALASFPTPAANRHDHEPHHQLIAKNLIVSYITASTSDVPLLDQCLGIPEGRTKAGPSGRHEFLHFQRRAASCTATATSSCAIDRDPQSPGQISVAPRPPYRPCRHHTCTTSPFPSPPPLLLNFRSSSISAAPSPSRKAGRPSSASWYARNLNLSPLPRSPHPPHLMVW